ncbi:MAG: metallophosphoesterase family protein [Bacteroidota bacterium]
MQKKWVAALWIVTALVLAGAASAVTLSLFGGGGGGTVATYAGSVPTDTSLVFLSDTQSPLLPERILLSESRNSEARELILGDIRRERPAAIFHCGDLVSLGFWDRDWARVDAFVERLNAEGIPFYPVLGNHELMIFSWAGEKRFQKRYPYASRTGYSVRAGRLGVVLLNSNFSILTQQDIQRQQQWYDATLTRMEADTTISAVIVLCHHSPFTNSRIVLPSESVRERFVPLFLRHDKCKLFISGHAHAVEHFVQGGKDFLVIGGGGGLQQPLYTGDQQRWRDHYPDRREKRMFHYTKSGVEGDSLRITVRMVDERFSSLHEVYTLSIGL